ncbi:hypothetical protein EYZ11_009390 [Aspergillus tanneri]|uniref:Condensation domain-containing protein n=1 Tax=Aspergillus tanneri TaxID=1220188 RepID=A0A4S3J875_9EURO|nr:hypothetical protein EYZ11_009390 [Aspergillus tanneri]
MNDPDKTAEVYIPAPDWLKKFRNKDTSWHTGRLYRSGDLVQYTHGGGIRFLGRRDTQVKLRVQRIELGEVEYQTARAFPCVKEVVAEVVYRGGNKCDATLVVFIVTTTDSNEALEELFVGYDSQFAAAVHTATVKLSKQLPRYMVPATFLRVSHVPRSGSGKIDRWSLREQAAAMRNPDEFSKTTRRTAPRELTMKQEHLLRDLSAARPPNFPDGHFNHPTLSELARATERSLQDITVDDYRPGSLLGITDLESFVTRFPGLPATLAAENLADVLPTTQLQGSLMDDQNATYFVVSLPNGIDMDRLNKACLAMVDHNPSLRTILVPYGAQYIQIILRQVNLPITQLTCEGDMEEFVQSVCTQDYNTPIPPEVPQSYYARTSDSVVEKDSTPIMKGGVTMATLTKAAWALVLAQVTGQDDVVFGNVLNGRELPIANAEEVPGPCITVLPLRVSIQRSWTVQSLLWHVQQQYKRAIPFSSAEFYEIKRLMAAHWSPEARLCSVFTHQNEGVERTIPFQNVECPMEMFQHNDSTPFHVVTGPQGDNLLIAMSVLDPAFCQEDINDLEKLATTIIKLAADDSAALEF